MPKDLYVILGIDREASLEKIKSAYRKIARECHPDKSPLPKNRKKFLAAKEAYETLRDSKKRKQYNSRLDREKSFPVVDADQVEEIITHRMTTMESGMPFAAIIDDLFQRTGPGLFSRPHHRQRHLHLDLIMTPAEAAEGGTFPLSIPVIEPCKKCQGSGYLEDYFCIACAGFGKIRTHRNLGLQLPANISHGREVTISLEDIGLTSIYLHVRILIGNYL